MALKGKKFKFALKMKNDVEVRTLQELKDAFDLNQMMSYYLDGKLETWLSDRYYDDLVDQINALKKNDPELGKKLCEIFGVDYKEDNMNIEDIEKRNKRIKKLKEVIDDEEIIKNIDYVAFSQEELADLLDEGVKKIYLCGKNFMIPERKKDITYIGINTKLNIDEEKKERFKNNGVKFIDLFDIEEPMQPVDESIHEEPVNNAQAIFLCKGDPENRGQENFLAYVTQEAFPYEDDNFRDAFYEVKYQANIKVIKSPDIVKYTDAVYNGDKIVYTAEDRNGSLLAVMDYDGENNRVLRRWNENSDPKEQVFLNHYFVGKQYTLVQSVYDGICERYSMNGENARIQGIEWFSMAPWMPQRFWEMSQGFYSIVTENLVDWNSCSCGCLILYEILNEETSVRTYRLVIDNCSFKLNSDRIPSTYGDLDTGRIYFFLEVESYRGYFYFIDTEKKELHLAFDQEVLLKNSGREFVVKDNKVIFFNSGCKNIIALDMNTGEYQILWENIENIETDLSHHNIWLIKNYLYFTKNYKRLKFGDIYRMKLDGTEKTVIMRNINNIDKIEIDLLSIIHMLVGDETHTEGDIERICSQQ